MAKQGTLIPFKVRYNNVMKNRQNKEFGLGVVN